MPDHLHDPGDPIPNRGAILSLVAARALGLDRIAAAAAPAAAAMIAVGALRIFARAWDALMDRSAPPGVVQVIAAMATGWPGVRGFHDLKTRTAGTGVFVHPHIERDGDMLPRKAHAIIAAYPQPDGIIHRDVAR